MNRFIAVIVSAVLFSGITGCTGEKNDAESGKEEVEKSDTLLKLPVAGSVSGDTMNLHGQFVVFYASEDTTNDLAIQAFSETTVVIVDSLKKTANLPVAVTSVNNFWVYNRDGSIMILSRKGFPEKTGILMMDGLQPPGIRKGNITIDECHALIKKYFLRP